MGLQKPPEESQKSEPEVTGPPVTVQEGVGPLGLRPGDKVRLKNLKSDQTMNGLLGSFVQLEQSDDGDRYHVELENDRGPVSVRVTNITKVNQRITNKRAAPGAAPKAEAAPKKEAAPKSEPAKKGASKAAARPKPKATAATPQKQDRNRRRPPAAAAKTPTKPRRGRDDDEEQRFNEQEHRICAHPCVEVKDPLAAHWRPVHIFESLKDGRIVLAYGNGEFEGLPPSKPYRLEGVAPNASGVLFWNGKGGRLLDSDGELIETRQRPRE